MRHHSVFVTASQVAIYVSVTFASLLASDALRADDTSIETAMAEPTLYAPLVTLGQQGKLLFHISEFDPMFCLANGTMTDEVAALEDPDIQNELGLDLKESPWIKEFSGRHKPVYRRVQKRATDLRVNALQRWQLVDRDFNLQHELGKSYFLLRDLRKSVNEELKAHFSRETWRRFVQLRMRHHVMSGGLLTALIVDPTIHDQIDCDDATIDRLSALCQELRKELDVKVTPLYAKLLEEALAVLTQRQRAKLEPIVMMKGEKITIPYIEFILWQCRYAQKPRKEYKDEIEEIASTSHFYVDPAGQIQVFRSVRDPLSGYKRALAYSRDIDLRDEQAHEIAREEVRRLKSAYDADAKTTNDWKYGRIDYSEMVDRLYDSVLHKTRVRMDLYREYLSPSQAALAKQLLQRQALRQRGLLPSLTNGQLGNTLGITDDQRRKLCNVASKYALSAQDLSTKLEAYVWGRIRKELPAQQRARLATLVGSPPTKMPGSPTLIVLDRANYVNTQGLHRLAQRISQARRFRGLDDTPHE